MLASVPSIGVIRRQQSEAASRAVPLGVKRLPSREDSTGFQRQQFRFFSIKLETSWWLWHSHGRTAGLEEKGSEWSLAGVPICSFPICCHSLKRVQQRKKEDTGLHHFPKHWPVPTIFDSTLRRALLLSLTLSYCTRTHCCPGEWRRPGSKC